MNMNTLGIAAAGTLLLSLLVVPGAQAVPVHCDFNQCLIEECTSPRVVGPVGQIDCPVGPVFCEHPFYTVLSCDIWQVCYVYGTGVVGCAVQGDGHGQASCVGASTCNAIHTFRVGPGAGPFYNLCSTLGTGAVSPNAALPTATVATNVKVSCSISATVNT
ncbi:MAG: hypothetical protein QOI63_1445 [Thermoplasmata archaeon]|jgi:hypothetical protein|nr:hypothetical protein [Thermoplasmata archaeon]